MRPLCSHRTKAITFYALYSLYTSQSRYRDIIVLTFKNNWDNFKMMLPIIFLILISMFVIVFIFNISLIQHTCKSIKLK